MANVMSDFDIDEFKRMNEDGQQNFLTKNHLVSDNLSNGETIIKTDTGDRIWQGTIDSDE